MRRLVAAAGAAALALGASGATALDRVRIGLPVAGEISFAPIDVAQDKGFFAEAGIDAQVTIYRGAGAAEEALAAGAADVVNLVPSGVALGVKKGIDERIIACGPQVSPDGWHMLVRAGGPIASLKDLDGKRVGVSSKNSTTDFYALWAEQYGKVKFETVPLGPSQVPALKSDQVAAIVRAPAQSIDLILSGQARSLVDFKAAMPPNIPECWTATGKLVRDAPKTAQGFVAALIRATRLMQGDKALSLSIMRKMVEDKSDAYYDTLHGTVIASLTTEPKVDLVALQNSLALASLAGLKDLPPAETLVADFAK